MRNRSNKIAEWVNRVVNNKSWERYADIHIDEVNADYASKEHWVLGGLTVLDEVVDVLHKRDLASSFSVALSYSLQSGKTKVGMNFFNFQDMSNQFDSTPPSVYLFKKDWPPFLETLNRANRIKSFDNVRKDLYYLECKNAGEPEYRRALLIVK